MNDNQITYDTMKILFDKINEKGLQVFLIGGISAAVQSGVDLYRKNSDLDIIVNVDDLPDLIQILNEINYTVEDKRKNLTRNSVDFNGNFYARDHELNADTDDNLLGIGIFTYEKNKGKVITHSYAYHEKEDLYVESIREIPERLFNLMYDNTAIEYHGVKVRCQTRAYTYLKKSKGERKKDKQDAEIIGKVLTKADEKDIREIKRLEKTMISYLVEYDKDRKEISRTRIPTFEEKLESYINSVREKNLTMSDDEIKQTILEDIHVKKIIENDNIIKEIIERWKNSSSKNDIAVNVRKIAHDYLNQTEFDKMLSNNEKDTQQKEILKDSIRR